MLAVQLGQRKRHLVRLVLEAPFLIAVLSFFRLLESFAFYGVFVGVATGNSTVPRKKVLGKHLERPPRRSHTHYKEIPRKFYGHARTVSLSSSRKYLHPLLKDPRNMTSCVTH